MNVPNQVSQSSNSKSWLTRSKQARTRRSWLNGVRSSGLKTVLYNLPRKLSNKSLIIGSHKLHDVHYIRVLGSFCQSDVVISSKVRWRNSVLRKSPQSPRSQLFGTQYKRKGGNVDQIDNVMHQWIRMKGLEMIWQKQKLNDKVTIIYYGQKFR